MPYPASRTQKEFICDLAKKLRTHTDQFKNFENILCWTPEIRYGEASDYIQDLKQALSEYESGRPKKQRVIHEAHEETRRKEKIEPRMDTDKHELKPLTPEQADVNRRGLENIMKRMSR